MLVQYTVLLLLEALHGSLAEIELTRPDLPADGGSQWLWIEGNTVTALQPIGSGSSSKRVFDSAVLSLDGGRAELSWASGRREALSVSPQRTLRPEFQRLVHQHLN